MWRVGQILIMSVALAIGLVGRDARGIVIRDDQSDAAYVGLGANAAYDSVGMFNGTTATSGFVASGTLVAPSWVLTAAHVVDNATALTFTIDGTQYTADKMIADPKWTGNAWNGYDIGLVHLSKPVTGVTPAVLYNGSSELGQTGVTVGYGMTGTGLTGATHLDGQKRGAQNVLDQILGGRLMVADFDKPQSPYTSSLGLSVPQPLEGLIAPGDSGGGVFMATASGNRLVGVNSFISGYGTPNASYGDVEGLTRVSAFDGWIDGIIDGQPGSQPTDSSGKPLMTAGGATKLSNAVVPEPSAISLLLIAGLFLFLVRRIWA